MIELRKLMFQMFNKTSRLLQGKGIGSKFLHLLRMLMIFYFDTLNLTASF